MTPKDILSTVVCNLHSCGQFTDEDLEIWSRIIEQMTENGLLKIGENLYFQLVDMG